MLNYFFEKAPAPLRPVRACSITCQEAAKELEKKWRLLSLHFPLFLFTAPPRTTLSRSVLDFFSGKVPCVGGRALKKMAEAAAINGGKRVEGKERVYCPFHGKSAEGGVGDVHTFRSLAQSRVGIGGFLSCLAQCAFCDIA